MFHNYWKPANGFGIKAETAFYFGKVEIGGQLSFVKARQINQINYNSLYMYFGWLWEQTVFDRLHIYSGFRLGHYFMYFDDDYTDINLKSESEFGFGIKAGSKYNLGNNFFIDIEASHQIIYTFHRIHLSYISIGLGKTFETPKWLREFLK